VNVARCFGVEGYRDQRCRRSRRCGRWPKSRTWQQRSTSGGRSRPIRPTVTQALVKGAQLGGATILENHRGDGHHLEQRPGDRRAYRPRRGSRRIRRQLCRHVVPRSGQLAGVDVPLLAAEHYYLISEEVAGVHPLLPILRDPGNCAYIREEAGKLMVGLFEPVAKPWGEGGIPDSFCFDDLPPDWDRMLPYLEKAMRRVPQLSNTGIRLLFCGPESFTPDHNYLMGEAPNLRNFFIAAGFNSLGILSGGGGGTCDVALDRRGAPADGRVVGGRAPDAAVAEQPQVSARPHRRKPWHRLPGPLAVSSVADCPGREEERSARSPGGGRGVLRRVGRLGAAELVRSAGSGAALRIRLGPAELVRQQCRGAPGGARRGRNVRTVVLRETARAGTGRRSGC